MEGLMNIGILATAQKVAISLSVILAVRAEAAEIRVLCTSATTATTNRLFAEFERETGHKTVVRYEFGPGLRRQAELNETFDVAIVSFDVAELTTSRKITDGTRVVIGRTGLGAAVKKGAVKPDISTSEALKRTLLSARSISYSAGSSGPIILALFERPGIAEDIKSKLVSSATVSVEDTIAKGEPELLINGVAVILRVPGAELMGWLQSELQSYVVFTGGISAASRQPEAGKALLRFLTTAKVVLLLKANGIEPSL